MEKHGNGGFEDVSKKSKSKIWEHFLLNKSTSMASCNICSKLLKVHGGGTKSMHFHLKAKHSISVPKIMSRSLAQMGRKKNPQTLVPITEKSFICDICGKGFTKKNILRGHLRRHMEKLTPDAEKKDLICELCGYTTKIMKNFKRHKQSKHETEKHHQCPYCEFHHHVIGCLHIHIDSKHPEHDKKQFLCDHCSRSFIFKISLKKHHENLRTIARLREKNLREKGIIH